jgi:plastocyanin
VGGSIRFGALLAGVAILSSCSSANPPAGSRPASASPEPPLAPVSANPAVIAGMAPAAVNDVPSVIVLRARTPLRYAEPADKPMMDQVAHVFTPGVLIVRTGLPANFRNDDDVLHNVRVREREKEGGDWIFNVVLPQGGSYGHTFERDGLYDVRCDMHQNMWALVVSASTPYGAVADANGAFTIQSVQPGAYTAVVYTGERKLERPLEVVEGQRLELELGEGPRPRTSRR